MKRVARGLSRRHLLGGAAVAGLVSALPARAEGRVQLPLSASLRDEALAAARRGQPLVVMVSLEGCPFCRAVRDSYLGPLREEQQLAVVQVDMQSARKTQDFDGVAVTHDELIRRWGIRLAPTLLFFGPGGRELARRLPGASLPDFYGAYLDERLAQAHKALRG